MWGLDPLLMGITGFSRISMSTNRIIAAHRFVKADTVRCWETSSFGQKPKAMFALDSKASLLGPVCLI